MPSNVGALLSGGVSVGILAGVVSGLFYLVVAGLRWAGEVRHFSGEWFNKQLQRHLGTPTVEDNRRHRIDDGSAMDSESSQVREFIERLVETLISGGLDQVNVNRLYSHPEYDRMFECHHGSLCDALTRLAFALQMAIANKPLEESDSPSAAHADLKQLIHKIVREAMTLPALHQISQNGSVNGKAIQDDINTKTYEEILATAILNKVIQRFQQYSSGSPGGAIDGNSNLLPVREAGQRPKFVSRVEIGMASSSSVDDDASAIDDGSWSGSCQTEPMSLTVEECVEEEMTMFNSSEEEEERGEETTGAELDFYLSGLNFIKKHRVPFPELGMDIVDGAESEDESERDESFSPLPTDLLSPVDSWEDNWLFQRRRLKTLGSRDPVPMLVPNPSEDFRALIGDRDAEEISDLSDCSESVVEDILADDDDDDHVPASKQELTKKASLEISLEVPRLVESVELPREPKKEISTTTDDYLSLVDHEMDVVEARNTEFSNGMDSLSEFGQQDSEYTEDYASVTRRQMNSLKRHQGIETNSKPVPRPRTLANSSDNSIDGSYKKESAFESSSDFSLESTDSVNEFATPPRPGTIAEREHKKWESAVPLPNNPYSQENIMKRLNKSSLLDIRTNCNTQQEKGQLPEINGESMVEKSATIPLEKDTNISRYGRDYYINASKTSSGCRNQTARPVEIIMTSKAARPQAEVADKCETVIVTSDESCTQSERLPARVGSKVFRWQNEINQTEEVWLRRINGCKNESDTSANDIESKRKDKKAMVKKGVHNKTLIQEALSEKQNTNSVNSLLEKENSHLHSKQEEISNNLNNNDAHNSNIGTNHNSKEIIILKMSTDSSKMSAEMPNGHAVVNNETNEKLTNGDCGKVTNGNFKNTVSGPPSEGSASSDCEHNFLMPSVKDLAKHFTQPNHNNKTKSAKPTERPSGRQVPGHTDIKKAADGPNQLMREVHSLTARSISREFREELKRNLPSQRDRNMHGSDSSLARSDSSLDQGLSSHPRGSDMDTSTTPGYTSDESSDPSPTPGNLRSNIAFWEQMNRNK